jgi:hypothetical protein
MLSEREIFLIRETSCSEIRMCKIRHCIGFEVLTAASMKMGVF